MANLVSPGYKKNKLISNILSPVSERVIEFRGLNRRSVVEEGEMSDMLNLSSDGYPTLTQRPLRGKYTLPTGAVQPYQILERFERIAMIAKDTNDEVSFYYHLTKVANVTGLTADTRMVAINNKICFFPQKTYLEIVRSGSTVSTGNYGSLEATLSLTSASVSLATDYAYIDIGNDTQFAYDDAVQITGTLYYTRTGELVPVNKDIDVFCLVEGIENNKLVTVVDTITAEITANVENVTFTGTIKRTMPTLDVVIEWNNRLWGASNLENTIYACKLGDPKNWQYYQGTSMDSYYATQGTDEDWTGAAAYSNHLIFFKSDSMLRIYGSAPANYQLTNTQAYGVEPGSRDSVCVINDTVFYKSTVGIMAYEGGIPYCISEKFNTKFSDVVCGTEGRKLYASIKRSDNTYELMVLDTDLAIWHKEDNARMTSCCTMGGRMYFINGNDDLIYIVNPETATETYAGMSWRAVFGPFDEFIENRKIYSRILMRLAPETTSDVTVYIKENDGSWEKVYEFNPAVTTGDFIPIIPRRCDRYSIKIEGTGKCAIKSLTRRVREGTGGRL